MSKYTGFSQEAIKWRTHAPLRSIFGAKSLLDGCHHIKIKLVRRNRSRRDWRSYTDLVLQIEGFELPRGDFQ